MATLKKILSNLIILITITNCVEHKIRISVEPNGSFKYSHLIEGDKDDILNLDYPIPESSDWIIKNNLNNLTEPYFYSFEKKFNENQTLPNNFYNDDSIRKDILLNHKMNLDYKNRLIYEYYNFNFSFEGRDAKEKYPILHSFIQNQEQAPQGWVHNGLSYIFNQAIIESNIGFNIKNIISLAINDWLNIIKRNYDNESLQENFEFIKMDGIEIVKKHLIDDSIENFIILLTKFEQETRITIDLADDIFELYLFLPGFYYETNADSIFNDTLLWRFSGIDFADKDYQLIARSSIYHKSRFHWTIVSIMLIVTFITLYWITRNVPDPLKTTKNSN
ncbi:MAG: hypothetical protein CMF96_03530 [Candidatus Marinimicrobia bacterium]|nr:hypothetical protein [Candidatus Neomarinimicrobiota bacterium]